MHVRPWSEARADVTVWLAATGWSIHHIETDGLDTIVSRNGVTLDGGLRFRITQRMERAGDQVSHIRIVVRGVDAQTEVLPVEVRYHGQVQAR
jgi:hypothetical protein